MEIANFKLWNYEPKIDTFVPTKLIPTNFAQLNSEQIINNSLKNEDSQNLSNKDSVFFNLTGNTISYIFTFLDKLSLTKVVPYVSKQWHKSFQDIIVLKRINHLVFGDFVLPNQTKQKLIIHGDIYCTFAKKVWHEINLCRDWIAHEIAINRMYGNHRVINGTKKNSTRIHTCSFQNNAVLDRLMSGEYALKCIFKNVKIVDDYFIIKDINELLILYRALFQPGVEYSDELKSRVNSISRQILQLSNKLQVFGLKNIYMIVVFLLDNVMKTFLNSQLDESYFTYSQLTWVKNVCESVPYNNQSCTLCVPKDHKLRQTRLYTSRANGNEDIDIYILSISQLKNLCQSCTECICEYLRSNDPKQSVKVTLNENTILISQQDYNTPQFVGFNYMRHLFYNYFDDANNNTESKSTVVEIQKGKYKNYLDSTISKYQNMLLKQDCFLKTKNRSIIDSCMNDVIGFQEQCRQYYIESKNGLIPNDIDDELFEGSMSDSFSCGEIDDCEDCDDECKFGGDDICDVDCEINYDIESMSIDE